MPLIEISTSRVIEEVKRHPTLWNTADPYYRSKHMRNKAWQAILQTLVPSFEDMPLPQKQLTDKAIQQRWKTARDSYMRNKALMKSGAFVKKYFYFDMLSFLDDIGPGWYEPRVPPETDTSKIIHHKRCRPLSLQVEPLSPSAHASTTSPPPKSKPPTTSQDPSTPLPNTSISTTDLTVKIEPNEIDNDEYHENSLDPLNLHTEIDIDDEMVNNEMQKDIPIEYTSDTATASQSKQRKVMKRKIVGSEINVEIYKMLKKTTNDLKDDNMAFFMSMLPMINTFSDRRKLLFRSEVIRIALELSSQDD
ncbi:hypothetical protein O0L34_g5465 [Tuta absoluta]|nr:hypothetical protein O0L34_g5465 [Tuta absoluta]